MTWSDNLAQYEEQDPDQHDETPEIAQFAYQIPEAIGHVWKGYGQEVRCLSCAHPHGFILPVGYHLVDVKDGQPVIEKLFDGSPEAQTSGELPSSGVDTSL